MLRRDARSLGFIASGSVAVPLLFGAAAGLWMQMAIPGALGPLGSRTGFAVAVAICVAVTALPVLAAVLQEMGLLGTRLGQTALALAALNDAALWIMLAVLLVLTNGGTLAGLAAAFAWFVLLIRVIRPLLVRLDHAADQTILVVATALALVSAALSEALGTGYLIGAFAAGVIIPAPCRPALLLRLEMITANILLPFFFMSTGFKALIEPGSPSFLTLLAVALAATIGGKLLGTALPARTTGFSWRDSLTLGFMMQTKGLMEVVVLTVLHDAGLIGTRIFSGMVAMAILCTVLTAPAVRLLQFRRPHAILPATAGDPT